ncbi:MAG: hypothetical protein A2506_06830 [Elusimicrobia bacterium RIFOXYD12_FULL_66_9]|nr:MAG: hypothetical protein A2506_06830 [Elusimicrobia bacterium RIFOXYD12_FULL_66_9]
MIPSLRDVLINPKGFPHERPKPTIHGRGEFTDVLYGVDDIVSDWDAYAAHLTETAPGFHPRVLLVSHDMTEIENITLMALGGVVKGLNGEPCYLLVNPGNCAAIDAAIESFRPDWIGFNLYTGLTDHVFEWLQRYKMESARRVFKKDFESFGAADRALKDAVAENGGGPLREGARATYAPVIVGGHYNNHDYKTSFTRGADYSVRGKGVNLLKDILLGAYTPGIYHDPISFPNLPVFDREGFYRDTFAFSDKTKKYALSPIKSVLTALGCAYRCTYCYIGSLIENQNDAYRDSGVKPPSIIQDRPLEVVLREGCDIRRLDERYGAHTKAVFDQADISLNNLEWWEKLRPLWTAQVGIPFYIQARPAMLAGAQGAERIRSIAQDRLVAGISMAIESGDPEVRRLLLKRMESNETILDALKNVKSFMIPIRTQAITGLPVIRPRRKPSIDIGLVDPAGGEHYYDDPLQETLKCLDLVASSGLLGKEDYYWNSLYSPFPGTPLGDYSFQAGFHDGATDSKEKAYMFTSEVGLNCFEPSVVRKQVAFHRTANFFAHLLDGKDMMTLYLYSNDEFTLEGFAGFVEKEQKLFRVSRKDTKFGLIPDPPRELLMAFLDHAYPETADAAFKALNVSLLPYYETLLDGLVLAAKIAVRYFLRKAAGSRFDLDQLARVERDHYYDNSYYMTYVPKEYADFLRPHLHSPLTPSRRPRPS